MTNDPVADFITRLLNASTVKKALVSLPFSNFKLAIAEKLKDAGYVHSVEKKGKKVRKTLDVTLKYTNGEAAIHGVKRISKPGRRVYKGFHDVVPVRYGHGSVLLSTPKGIMTGKEAKKAKVGGEALFEIW
jgi:small subunit ribosomal protein S8